MASILLSTRQSISNRILRSTEITGLASVIAGIAVGLFQAEPARAVELHWSVRFLPGHWRNLAAGGVNAAERRSQKTRAAASARKRAFPTPNCKSFSLWKNFVTDNQRPDGEQHDLTDKLKMIFARIAAGSE